MISPNKNLHEDDGTVLQGIVKAALDDDNKLVGQLLQQGVDINTNFQGFTALHVACMHGNRELVDVLLNHSRSVQPIDFAIKTTDRGMLAWQLAAAMSHFDLAEKVVDAAHPEIAVSGDVVAFKHKSPSARLVPQN